MYIWAGKRTLEADKSRNQCVILCVSFCVTAPGGVKQQQKPHVDL